MAYRLIMGTPEFIFQWHFIIVMACIHVYKIYLSKESGWQLPVGYTSYSAL